MRWDVGSERSFRRALHQRPPIQVVRQSRPTHYRRVRPSLLLPVLIVLMVRWKSRTRRKRIEAIPHLLPLRNLPRPRSHRHRKLSLPSSPTVLKKILQPTPLEDLPPVEAEIPFVRDAKVVETTEEAEQLAKELPVWGEGAGDTKGSTLV